MSIKIDGPAPSKHDKRKAIVRIKSFEPMQVICLSESIFSVMTHWSAGRSDRCYAADGDCHHCNNGLPLRWRGYVNVLVPPATDDVFIEFSESVAQSLSIAFADRDSLRGAMFKISKSKGGLRGRFVVEALERRIEPFGLPEADTPVGVLKFLWNVKRS